MLVKESVDNKELLSHQQSVTTAKTTKEDQNPVYADAGRQMEKTAKIKADVVKVEEEPKRDEKPKAPKMTPGARKMHLDESLFEDGDSNFKFNVGDTAYELVFSFDNHKKGVYDSVTITGRWVDEEWGNLYSYTDARGSKTLSCPEHFLLNKPEMEKEIEQGSRLSKDAKVNESLKEAKNPKFVGQFARKQTDDEINRFVDVFKKVLANNGFDTANMIVDRTGNDEKPGYFGVSAVVVKCPVSGLDSKRKNRQGDTVWGINNIIMRCYAEDGYSDYDNHLPQLQDKKGYGNDSFDAKQYNIYLSTDGKIKPYKKHYKYAYALEGNNHFHYDDTIEEFENDIDSYLKGLKRTIGLSEKLNESLDNVVDFDKIYSIVEKYLGNYLTDDELESAAQSIMQSISKNSSDLVDSIRNGLLPYIRTEVSFDDIKDIVPEIKSVLNIVTEAKNDIESKLYDELSRIWAGVDKNGKPKHAEVYSNPQGNGYKIETELKNVIDEASKIAEKYKLPYKARPFRNYYLFTVDLPEKLTEARIGKTKEVKVLQGNYGYGWDDLVTYDIEQFDNDYLKMMAEIRQDRKDYDNNEQGVAHRVITRRVPRETLKENKINLKK